MLRTDVPEKKKVLVYLFGSLGDTLVAIPALRTVRRHFRDAELVMLQNVAAGNIVMASEVIPDDLVDRYLGYRTSNYKLRGLGKIISFYKLWKNIRHENFHAVVYLVISERSERSVLRDKMFFRSCGIRELVGFHAFTKEVLYPVDENQRPAMTQQEAVRKLERLELDGLRTNTKEDLRQPLFDLSSVEVEITKEWLASVRRNPNAKLIAIAPGCKTISNLWPIERFIAVGTKLIVEENCEIVIVGGKGESSLAEDMIKAWGEGINAAGKFSVRESASLISRCNAYIGLDTGTTHLAAAVGTPCFGIYGERNNPGHWYPLGNGHKIIHHPVPCAGCRSFDCPIQGHPCMHRISSDAVWKELQEFIISLGNVPAAQTSVCSV